MRRQAAIDPPVNVECPQLTQFNGLSAYRNLSFRRADCCTIAPMSQCDVWVAWLTLMDAGCMTLVSVGGGEMRLGYHVCLSSPEREAARGTRLPMAGGKGAVIAR